MSCIAIEFPPLPPIGSIAGTVFALPSPSFSAAACCAVNLNAFLPTLSLPPIPILSAALAIINAEIQLLNAFLDAYDLAPPCPLE